MIKEAFEKWYIEKFGDSPDTSSGWNKRTDIWQYFAPKLRGEFPREAVTKVVDDLLEYLHTLGGRSESKVSGPSRIDAIEMLERLWKGGETKVQESISEEGMAILSELADLATSGKLKIPGDARELSDRAMVMLYKKPVCRTCGGSGEVTVERRRPVSWVKFDSIEPCPACKPKCFKCGYIAETLIKPPREHCRPHRFVDQRKGQRRKTLNLRGISSGRRTVDAAMRDDRRTGNRRD